MQSAVAELSASITKLATPQLLASEIKNTDSGIQIGWEVVNGAASYDIYRKTSDSEYAYIGNTSKTTYVDTTALNGIKYSYKVAAKDANGGVGAYGVGYTFVRLVSPTGLATLTVANGIEFTWGAVAGADKYFVYRATTTDDFEIIGETTATTYTDTTAEKDVLYRYTVKAYTSGISSAYNTAGVQGKNFGTVSELACEITDNGALLTWNLLTGADGYKIYRKNANGGEYVLLTTVTGTNTYEDTTIPSGVLCNYKVEPYSGVCVGIMTAPSASAKYLAIPKIDAANAGDGMISVVISSVYGAEKYIIERADGEGSTTFVKIAEITGTEYMDEYNIVAGEFYQYRVKAVAGTLESAYGSDSLYKMIAPTIKKLTNEIAGIKIEWSAVGDATGYNVYRKQVGTTQWKLIRGNVQTTYYTDATVGSGEGWQYTVEAITPDGTTGYNLIGKKIIFLETPDVVSLKNTTSGIKFTWDKVKGATGYYVYRREYKNGKWSGWTRLYTAKATATSYTDTSKKSSKYSGIYYRYTVKAICEDDGVTYNGGYDSYGLKIKNLTTPDVKSATNGSSGITVKWSKVSGASKYYVYRSEYKNGDWTGWKKIYEAKSSASSYTDKSIKSSKNSGKNYKYTVRAVSGEYSSAYESGVKTKWLSVPTLKSATSSKSGITFKWNKVTGASGYYVYRKTGSGSWKKIATVKGGTKISYVDKSAKKGKTYKYTVRAYNGSYTSAYSSTGKTCKDLY